MSEYEFKKRIKHLIEVNDIHEKFTIPNNLIKNESFPFDSFDEFVMNINKGKIKLDIKPEYHYLLIDLIFNNTQRSIWKILDIKIWYMAMILVAIILYFTTDNYYYIFGAGMPIIGLYASSPAVPVKLSIPIITSVVIGIILSLIFSKFVLSILLIILFLSLIINFTRRIMFIKILQLRSVQAEEVVILMQTYDIMKIKNVSQHRNKHNKNVFI